MGSRWIFKGLSRLSGTNHCVSNRSYWDIFICMPISGPDILVRTLSTPHVTDRHGNVWSYHSRSDHHSKVACWGIVFDLLRSSTLFRRHVSDARVGFGINHEIRDFQHDRRKDLDLVVCQPASSLATGRDLGDLATHYGIELTSAERRDLGQLPILLERNVGNVLVALEAKACMTAHQRALPRLYDELNSSHLTVHGAHESAIAAGLVMINIADRFLSSDQNKVNRAAAPVWSTHPQPKSVEITIDKIKQLPRRSNTGVPGYDAVGIIVVDCINDGSPVRLHSGPPAPHVQDNYHYATLINRLQVLYDTRFAQL